MSINCQIKWKFFSVQPSVHPTIYPLIQPGRHALMQPINTYRQTSIACNYPSTNSTSPLFYSLASAPEPVVQNREILCSCWEEMASIRPSCCPSQTSASPSPAPVSCRPTPAPPPSRYRADSDRPPDALLFSSFGLSSHEDRLWKHGGEDGVQREVCQPGVFQLPATGQPGAADHQTEQRGRFLFQ